MTEIPQAGDQFAEDAPSEAVPPRRYIFVPFGRFAIHVADDIHLDELRRALNAGGFHMTCDADSRWCVDKVHAIALVQGEPANEDGARENLYPHLEG